MKKLGLNINGVAFLNKVEVNEEHESIKVYLGFGSTKEGKSKGYIVAKACTTFKALIQNKVIEQGDMVEYEGFATFNEKDGCQYQNINITGGKVVKKSAEFKKEKDEA